MEFWTSLDLHKPKNVSFANSKTPFPHEKLENYIQINVAKTCHLSLDSCQNSLNSAVKVPK